MTASTRTNTHMPPPRIALFLSAVAWGAGCADREPDARSEYVDLYLDPGIDACGGQLASYDAFIEKVFDAWNHSAVPDDFRARVHARRRPRCDGHSCATDGNTWLFGDLGQYHEMAHVIHFALDGHSVTSLQEGMAEALGPLGGLAYRQSELASLAPDFVYKPEIDATEYGYAAAFTRFLVDHYGVDSYRDYFRRMGKVHSPDSGDFDREFENSFSEPLDDAWAEFISGPRCAFDYWYCPGGTPLTLPGSYEGIDCADPETIGFDASRLHLTPDTYSPTVVLRFLNDTDRPIRVGLENAFVYFGRCGDCAAQAAVPATLLRSNEDVEGISEQILSMSAGDYFFIVRRLGEGTTRVTLAPYE